jgi:hypothetical protein
LIGSELLGNRLKGVVFEEMEPSTIGNPSDDVEEAPLSVKGGNSRVRVELADATKMVSVRDDRVKQSGIIYSDNEGDCDVEKAEG